MNVRNELFKGLKTERVSISVGSVEKFYRRTYRADVCIAQSNQYLRKVMIASSYVGHGFGLITPLTEGDIVLIAFVGGSTDVPIIIGRLFTERIEPPDTEEDEVLLHHKSGTKVRVKANGDVVIDSGHIELGDGASEKIVLGNSFKTYLNSQIAIFNAHGHIGNMGAPTTSPATSMTNMDDAKLSNNNVFAK